MDRDTLERLSKDDLITLVLAQAVQIAALTARVAALETRLCLPPSKGQKASLPSESKHKGKPHPGAHRLLHPEPTCLHDVWALSCQACGADVSDTEQSPCAVYDRVEISAIVPDVTRVSLHGGVCPCYAKLFKAAAPAGLEPGSPFGTNIRAFVVYLRAVQDILLARLRNLLLDLFRLSVSEGALVAMLAASAAPFRAATSLIKARLLSGTALAFDETDVRVGRANWWLWVFHHGDSAVFVAAAHRSRALVVTFLGDHRPALCASDRYGMQAGWATKAHQACLAHLIRDVQYAIDAGDAVLGPGLKGLLKRACAIGRRRADLKDVTLKAYEADLERLLALEPLHRAGLKLRRTIHKNRPNMFVFVKNCDLEPKSNGSERVLRPCAIYRKITNVFRQEWGAHLYADIRLAIETTRRRSIWAIDAIRLTLNGEPIQQSQPAPA